MSLRDTSLLLASLITFGIKVGNNLGILPDPHIITTVIKSMCLPIH